MKKEYIQIRKLNTTLWLMFALFIGTIVLSGCSMSGLHRRHQHKLSDRGYAHSPSHADKKSPGNSENPWYLVKEGYSFEFHAVPQNPMWDEETILELSIYNISGNKDVPVTGARVTCKAVMTSDQSHMQGLIHNYKVHEDHWETSPGFYTMHIQFGMRGDWQVRYHIELPNSQKFQVSFPLKVIRPDDSIQEWEKIQQRKSKEKDLNINQ